MPSREEMMAEIKRHKDDKKVHLQGLCLCVNKGSCALKAQDMDRRIQGLARRISGNG
jgi:hypothetical protein